MSRARRGAMAALLGAGVLLSACTYTVRVSSRPPNGELSLADGRVVAMPADVPLRWKPLSRQEAVATTLGYRPLTVAFQGHPGLGRRPIIRWTDFFTDPFLHPAQAFGATPRVEVELVFVPEHGPVETWDATDVEAGGVLNR